MTRPTSKVKHKNDITYKKKAGLQPGIVDCGCHSKNLKHPVNRKGGEGATATRTSASANQTSREEPSGPAIPDLVCQPLPKALQARADGRWGRGGHFAGQCPQCSPNSYICIQAFLDLPSDSNQPPAIPATIESSVGLPNVTLAKTPIEISESFASSLRTSTGRSNILSTVIFGGKRVYVDLSARSHLHFPTAFESLRPLRQPDLQHTSPLFPNQPAKTQPPDEYHDPGKLQLLTRPDTLAELRLPTYRLC